MAWINAFAIRTAIELALRATGQIIPAAKQQHFARRDFDLDELPIPANAFKAAKAPRDPSKLTHIICHVTAVRGGFGLMKAAHRKWRERLEHPIDLPQRIIWQLDEAGDLFGDLKIPGTEDRLARRLGLWERYRSTPYHEIASQTGDCVANRRLSQRSYHAGPLNAFSAGFAIDCAPDEPLDSDMVATARHGLLCLAHRMVDAGCRTPIMLAPHRAGSSSRLADTSRTAWLAVIKPTAQEHPELLAIDYHLRVGSGRPIPRAWDSEAQYDSKGRRLA
jgi:hypothetical protein